MRAARVAVSIVCTAFLLRSHCRGPLPFSRTGSSIGSAAVVIDVDVEVRGDAEAVGDRGGVLMLLLRAVQTGVVFVCSKLTALPGRSCSSKPGASLSEAAWDLRRVGSCWLLLLLLLLLPSPSDCEASASFCSAACRCACMSDLS